MKYPIFLFLLFLLGSCSQQKDRDIISFNDEWRFALLDDSLCYQSSYCDSSWRVLNLPHDWSIEGNFSKEHPATPGGGALPGGTGWYRKTFTLPGNSSGRQVRIEFDGIYMNSRVYLNNHFIGYRPNGYVSFSYDLTPYLNAPGETNTLAVQVDNSRQPNSRWYSGSGIYRNVRLILSDRLHIPYCGTYVTTPEITTEKARVNIKTQVTNADNIPRQATLTTLFFTPQGQEIAKAKTTLQLKAGETQECQQSVEIKDPQLWDINQPVLYTAHSYLRDNQGIKDHYTTNFGIRHFRFCADSGFILNGRPTKIKGVCLHHDLGALGAAINTRALERQLQLLKEMGCNAIRTSHNPPAPEQLDLCDRMGILVMDETFDIWRKRKSQYDYSIYFDQWHEKDITDHIRRDRNHPSVFIWSIGNEVLEQWNQSNADDLNLQQANLLLNFKKKEKINLSADTLPLNAQLARRLVEIVKSADSTRPVTTGNNEPSPGNNLFRSGAMDIIGYNYHEKDYATVKTNFPGKPFIATETTSGLMTRGFYQMPSDSVYIQPKEWWIPFESDHYSCSSYDNCHVPWGSTHEKTWKLVRDNDFISGLFIWTGFDYLGEPTPYWWPARSSYFGILDLAGFPKDIYYLYQSEWTDTPVLHLFPHWNWQPGDSVDIWAYYNQADSVELFLNGQSFGRKAKNSDCLHCVWRLAYQPGTLTAISSKNGQEILRKEIHTAGAASQISLSADRPEIIADGQDLSFVTVEIQDANGYPVPDATNNITFSIEGPGILAGVDNGSPISHEPFKSHHRKAFYGKCLAIIQAKRQPGKIVLKASSPGLGTTSLTIVSR